MIVAGLLAFLFTYAALDDSTEYIEFAVTTADLPAGSLLDAASFGGYRLAVTDGGHPPGLLVLDDAQAAAASGRRLTNPVAAGSMLRAGDVAPGAAVQPRAIAIGVDRSHAVGGDLIPGDLVDVIAVDQGVARFVLVAAPVIAVGDGGSGAGRAFTITVEVDAPTSLRLARAMSGSPLEVIRSTGAAPADAGLVFPPAEVDDRGRADG